MDQGHQPVKQGVPDPKGNTGKKPPNKAPAWNFGVLHSQRGPITRAGCKVLQTEILIGPTDLEKWKHARPGLGPWALVSLLPLPVGLHLPANWSPRVWQAESWPPKMSPP